VAVEVAVAAGPEVAAGQAAAARQVHGEGARMAGMSRRSLKKCVDETRVLQAIRSAERASSGEIRVSMAAFFWGDVEKVARKAFVRLGMDQTAQRNGVLIFLVPSRKRFTILGDEGIHAKVGQDFWDEMAGSLSGHFKRAEFTEGLVEGITRVGERLAEHFPWAGDADRNELPDDVDYGA
jgi:uncharacterized membrane protein